MRKYNTQQQVDSADLQPEFVFFDNLPEMMRPERVASVLGISIKTIYDWKYRGHKRKVPENLFLKFNGALYIRTKTLEQWIASQNPSLAEC